MEKMEKAVSKSIEESIREEKAKSGAREEERASTHGMRLPPSPELMVHDSRSRQSRVGDADSPIVVFSASLRLGITWGYLNKRPRHSLSWRLA